MGIDLLTLALVHHAPRIGGRAFKVLAWMARAALDKPNEKGQPPNLYFGGWEALALVIGQQVSIDEADPDHKKVNDRAYEQVRRCLKELENAGLIERLVEHPHTGRAQTFRLHLDPSPVTEGQSPTPVTEGQSDPKQGARHARNGGQSPAETERPRTHLGLTKDLPQDINPLLSDLLQTARERESRDIA